VPKKPKIRALHPNVGIEVKYRQRLTSLIAEMHNSIIYWLVAAYRSNEPAVAQDELPANAMQKALKELRQRWEKRFEEMAPKLAEYFAKDVSQRSDASLKRILKQGGMSVKFKSTRAQKDVMAAAVHENVSLIKSIPQRHLDEVEGLVMRSVQRGRALGELSKELQQRFGATKRRAALIARDQNNKVSGTLRDVRQLELGIKEAIWIHSGGGKEPRPTHIRNNGQKYDIAKGWYDPAEKKFIRPGELINCKCVSRPVIAGFS
jgi:SPP1 gp7 family putative phage head morphogenesis protein